MDKSNNKPFSGLKDKLLKKKNLWHVGAIAGFLLIACIYFMPALKGYVVDQADVRNWAGAAQEVKDYRQGDEQIGWTNSMFSGMPATQIAMRYEGTAVTSFFRDAMTLWLPKPVSILFMYFIGFYIMAMSFRIKPLVAIIGALAFGFSSYFIIIIEAGHVTKALAVGYTPLLIAGFIYAYRWKNWILGIALSSLFMSMELAANHLQVMYYMIFVLIGLGVVELIKAIKKGKPGLLKFGKVTAGLLVAYMLAVLMNSGNILGTQEYTKATTRGGSELTIDPMGNPVEANNTSGLDRDYVTEWSYGRAETFTFIVPNFKGGESQRLADNPDYSHLFKDVDFQYRDAAKQYGTQYWGDQPFTSGPVYVGALIMLMALLGLIYGKDLARWGILPILILTVMLSWGKNFMGLTDFFLDHFPGYAKFRAVTIILVVAELCIPLLAVFFLHRLFKKRDKIAEKPMGFFIAAGATIGILLLFYAAPTLGNSFMSAGELDAIGSIPDADTRLYFENVFTEIQNIRISIFRADVLRSLAFVVIGGACIYLYMRKAFNQYVLGAAIAILVLLDLAGVANRYLSTEKKGKNYVQWVEKYEQEFPYRAGEGEKQILAYEQAENPELSLKTDSAYNAVSATFKNSKMSNAEKQRRIDWATYRTMNQYTNFRVLEAGNPYNSTYVSYFNKSIGGYHGAKLGRYQDLIEFHLSVENPAVLDMLNMKYKIQPIMNPVTRKIDNSRLAGVNRSAMGNAWFTKDVQFVENANEEILALNSGNEFVYDTSLFPLLVNGVPYYGAPVTLNEDLTLLYPIMDSIGGVRYDTVAIGPPIGQLGGAGNYAMIINQTGQLQWVADDIVPSGTTQKFIRIVHSGRTGWDPAKTTIVNKEFKDKISKESYSGEGSIELTSYHPDYLVYQTNSSSDQLAVFSEIYYPNGWTAMVDGQKTDILQVNYVLRAIEVPAGEHKIEFVYEIPTYKQSATLAWIGSILMIALLGFGLFMNNKLNGAEEEEDNGDGDDPKPSSDDIEKID